MASCAEGFRVELIEGLGHTPLVAATHVRLMARLSSWLSDQGFGVERLGEPEVVEAFFAARRAAGYTNETSPRALRPMLAYRRSIDVLPLSAKPVATDQAGLLLERYAAWLREQRGLAASTVALNVRLVAPFLTERAKVREGRMALEELSVSEVNAYVLACSRKQPRSVKRIVSALRSLLRFLHVIGVIEVELAASVPSPAGWRLAGVPKALEPDQVTALLASCDRRTGTGRRDFAMLLLMARLGLRAGEVAGLRLEDVDRHRGEITVRGKGNRHDRLPLPVEVGAAIVDYLRHGRPALALERTVFLRAQAPYKALASAGVIEAVAAAGRRAGSGVTGAHRLRHSAATAMLAAGSSLEEVGQVLRHVRSATTAIYAKVDLEALRTLARPWPGEADPA